MGIPTPQEITAAMVKSVPWIDMAKKYEENKTAASNLSSTVSGMKGDITLMKVEMAGLFALSVGLFKIDYTWFKIDDKGITINGRQRLGWPWADKTKAFTVRVENKQRDLAAKQNRMKRKLTRLSDRQRELASAQSALRHHEANQRNAEARLAQGRGSQAAVDHHRARADLARAEVTRLQKRLDRAEKSAKRTSDSAAGLVKKINELRQKENDAKNLWKNNAQEATGHLNSLRTAIRQTEVQLTEPT